MMKTTLSRAVAIAALCGSIAVASFGASKSRYVCYDYTGPFTSAFDAGPGCPDSPIGQCTHGKLGGDLAGTYEFSFDTQGVATSATDPIRFTGRSIVTLTSTGEKLFGRDTGKMHGDPLAFSVPFETTVNVYDGTGVFVRAIGRIVATGAIDATSGTTSGTYVATICQATP